MMSSVSSSAEALPTTPQPTTPQPATPEAQRSAWRGLRAVVQFVFTIPHVVVFAIMGVTTMIPYGIERATLLVPGIRQLVGLWKRRVSGFAQSIGKRVLADERDWPMLPTLAVVTLLVPISYGLQFVDLGVHWAIMGTLHIAILLGPRARRFIHYFSVKHNEAHRRRGLFRAPYSRLLGRYAECFLGFFYGTIPGSDYINHAKVHHAEDGGPDDHQTTLGYDRSNTYHFFQYVGLRHIHTTSAWRPLVYLWRRNRMKDFRRLLFGVAVYYLYALVIFALDWRAGLFCVGLPFLINNAFGALATWLQHAFHDPERADQPVLNTITLHFDDDFLNEGFHLAHHHRAACHWSELEGCFERFRLRNPNFEPIVIAGVDWLDLWLLLYVRRRLDLVAERWRPTLGTHQEWSLPDKQSYLRTRLGAH